MNRVDVVSAGLCLFHRNLLVNPSFCGVAASSTWLVSMLASCQCQLLIKLLALKTLTDNGAKLGTGEHFFLTFWLGLG